jgi:hypothetical protein
MAEVLKPDGINKEWAVSGAVLTPDDTKIATGWVVEQPSHQFENWLNRKHDRALIHLNQHGFFEWKSDNTEYFAGRSWVMGSNGWIYYCKVSQVYWRPVLNGQTVFTSPEVSTYMKTVLLSANQSEARQNLGMTTVGQNLVTSNTATDAMTFLGMTSLGQALATAPSSLAARNTIEVYPASDSVAGLVQRATDSESILGVDDTKFLTPKKLKLGFGASLTSNGYETFPSHMGGLQFKWGQVAVAGNSVTPVSAGFTNICLQPFVSLGTGTTVDKWAPKAVPSGTGFNIYNSDDDPLTIRWFAIGY